MNSGILLAAILAAGVAACGVEAGNVEPTTTGASFAAKGTARPMSGTCSTSYTISNQLPTSLEADHVGSCTLTHLGRTRLVKHEAVDFSGAVPVVHGTAVFTAANGDRVDATESAQLSALDPNGGFTFTGGWTVTGGTGRFQGASGQLDFVGSGSAATNTTERTATGWISY